MNEEPICILCKEKLGVMGELPDGRFPATVDSATTYSCLNENCSRYLLLTCA